MAKRSLNTTIGQALGGGKYNSVNKGGGSSADYSTVTADIAVLVADGASPTQGHVNTLNTDYGAVSGSINTGDVTVIWDTTNITSINQLRAALDAVIFAAQSGYAGALTL